MATMKQLRAAAREVGFTVEILNTDCDGNPGKSIMLDACEDYVQYPYNEQGIQHALDDIAQVQSVNALYEERGI